ncbi:hypothetical protein RJ641_023181 [Dillenia turbinata]|uniref:GH18 domain-containing protein n=1 Tax=Dillenia turbinata TaxID=194707 RepID=A0AAN8UDT0_9MAGN
MKETEEFVFEAITSDIIVKANHVLFKPTSINSWVRNAIYFITEIVSKYSLDGIDIDYEHFKSNQDTFAECMGRLLHYLKQNEIVAFTSIAPYEDDSVQPHKLALWRMYGHLMDYANFQFYAYPKGTTIPQFMRYFEKQSSNSRGAYSMLRKQGKLHSVFIWSADDSKQSQDFLAISNVINAK